MLFLIRFLLLSFGLSVSAAEGGSPAYIPPEAEVTASSGPVKLTLRVYKKSFPAAEKLRYQIEIKNVGKSPIGFDSKFFPHPSDLFSNEASHVGVYLEILTLRGRDAGTGTSIGEGCAPDRGPLIESIKIQYTKEDSEHLKAKQAEFRRAGLSEHVVDALMLKEKNYLVDKYLPPTLPAPQVQEYELQPGQSVTTPPWVCTRFAGKKAPAQKPIGQYAQYWEMPRPEWGPEFLVRAVYSGHPSERVRKILKKAGVEVQPEDVMVKTPSIRIKLK